MALTREEVTHVADLARLGLSDAEVERLQAQLSNILEHFQALQALDTEAIPPTAQVVARTNVVRGDEGRPSFPRDVMLANAPRAEEGCFRVKAVLEE